MPGNPLNITLPTVGATVGPTYATEINDGIQAIIDDVEAKITPDEIEMNDNLDFKPGATAYGAVGLLKAAFDAQTAVLTTGTAVDTIFAYNDELYFQDGTGANVAITSGGSVNSAPGNIVTTGTPTYPDIVALTYGLTWAGGDLEYRFLDDGTNGHAGLVFMDAQFRNGANSMTMESNVTTDYTVTWPTDAATGTDIIQITNAGVVSFSNTIVDAVTCTGLITASAGVTAAANQHVTISGTGEYKHGNKTLNLHSAMGMEQGTSGYAAIDGGFDVIFSHTSGAWLMAIPLKEGERIVTVAAQFNSISALSKDINFYVKSTASTATLVDNQSDTTSSGNFVSTMTLADSGRVIEAGEHVLIKITPGAVNDQFMGLSVVYDRP